MTEPIPKEKLTAYQRWELVAFDEAAREKAARKAPEPAPAPAEDLPPVVLPTAEEIDRMYADAHEQGYAAGYEEGIAAAREKAEQFAALMSGLQTSLEEVDQQVAEQLLATALEVANQVIRQALRVKSELVIPVVREAVSVLNPHQGHPALFAHPLDVALIREQLGDQLAHNNWRIIEDAALTRGGCRVEIGASEVDATLETRWRRVIESLGVSQAWLDDMP